MPVFDRAGIAARIRGLIGDSRSHIADAAKRLSIDELSIRMSIDELSPHPTVEVLAAVIREYGVDPSWLLTGNYDASTHRSAVDGSGAAIAALRDFVEPRAHWSSGTSGGEIRRDEPN